MDDKLYALAKAMQASEYDQYGSVDEYNPDRELERIRQVHEYWAAHPAEDPRLKDYYTSLAFLVNYAVPYDNMPGLTGRMNEFIRRNPDAVHVTNNSDENYIVSPDGKRVPRPQREYDERGFRITPRRDMRNNGVIK